MVEGSFGAHPVGGRRVVQRSQQAIDVGIVPAAFDADGALAHGRQAIFRSQVLGDARFQPQALQARRRQNDGVVALGFEFIQARAHVAAQVEHLAVGKTQFELALAAQAGGADAGAGRKVGQGSVTGGNEGVAGIFPLQDGGEMQAFGQFRRHVFDGVDREVRRSLENALLQLLHEEALAADLGQRRIQQFVAAGDHFHEFDFEAGMGRFEAGRHVLGLPQGERALAGSDTDGLGHEGAADGKWAALYQINPCRAFRQAASAGL